LPVSALAYDLMREVLRDSSAANRVVILDGCFSGRAIDDMAGDVIGLLGVEGTYVIAAMTSADRTGTAAASRAASARSRG
jgi:hypothetical protein